MEKEKALEKVNMALGILREKGYDDHKYQFSVDSGISEYTQIDTELNTILISTKLVEISSINLLVKIMAHDMDYLQWIEKQKSIKFPVLGTLIRKMITFAEPRIKHEYWGRVIEKERVFQTICVNVFGPKTY